MWPTLKVSVANRCPPVPLQSRTKSGPAMASIRPKCQWGECVHAANPTTCWSYNPRNWYGYFLICHRGCSDWGRGRWLNAFYNAVGRFSSHLSTFPMTHFYDCWPHARVQRIDKLASCFGCVFVLRDCFNCKAFKNRVGWLSTVSYSEQFGDIGCVPVLRSISDIFIFKANVLSIWILSVSMSCANTTQHRSFLNFEDPGWTKTIHLS